MKWQRESDNTCLVKSWSWISAFLDAWLRSRLCTELVPPGVAGIEVSGELVLPSDSDSILQTLTITCWRLGDAGSGTSLLDRDSRFLEW